MQTFKYRVVPVPTEYLNENISKHLDPTVSYIAQNLKKNEPTLIYGFADLQVCSVFAAAYLIREQYKTAAQAY